MANELTIPNENQLSAERNSLMSRCRAIVAVTTDTESENASAYLRTCKDLRKQISTAFKPVVDAAHQAHKKACEMLKGFDAPVEIEEKRLSRLLGQYQADKERIAREEAEKIRAEVERINRARLEREAEAARKENEAKAAAARAEQDRLRAEGRAKALAEAQERERLRQIAAERAAEEAAVKAAQAPPVVVDAAPVAKAVVDGISYRTDWKYEILDAKKVPPPFLKVDEVALAAYARAMKEKADVSGVRFYPVKTAVGR